MKAKIVTIFLLLVFTKINCLCIELESVPIEEFNTDVIQEQSCSPNLLRSAVDQLKIILTKSLESKFGNLKIEKLIIVPEEPSVGGLIIFKVQSENEVATDFVFRFVTTDRIVQLCSCIISVLNSSIDIFSSSIHKQFIFVNTRRRKIVIILAF